MHNTKHLISYRRAKSTLSAKLLKGCFCLSRAGNAGSLHTRSPRLFPRQKQSEVHTMHNRKSLYSRNKRNSRAILCPDVFEQDHPLTPEQFSSEEEFRFWKTWSDEDYHSWELADHIYSDHTSPLTEYSAAEPSPEETILARLDRRENVAFAQSSLQKIRGIVTEKAVSPYPDVLRRHDVPGDRGGGRCMSARTFSSPSWLEKENFKNLEKGVTNERKIRVG